MDQENEEVWTVVINAGHRTTTHRLSCNATIGEAIEHWERKHSRRRCSRAKSLSGDVLPRYQRLRDVGETVTSSKTVTVEIDEAVDLEVRLRGAPCTEDKHEISCTLSETPAELEEKVRQVLELSITRSFRLLSDAGLLESDLDLRQQQVAAGTALSVDVAFDVGLVNSWTDGVHQQRVFSSERLCDVAPGRFLFGQLDLDVTKELIEALPKHARTENKLWLVHQSQRSIAVVMGRSIRQVNVWPNDTLLSVWPRRLPLPSNCWWEDKPVSMNTTCRDIGVPDKGIIRASEEPRGMSFERPDDSARSQKTIRVDFADRSVRWSIGKKILRRRDVACELAARSGFSWEEVEGCSVECQGCGRRLMEAEEEVQQLPADCCSKRSLHLLISARRNCGTQAEVWLQRSPATNGDDVQTADSSCQTEVDWPEPMQTPKTNAEVQVTAVTAEVACQHQRASTSSKRFHIINRYPDLCSGQDFSLALTLSDTPSVGEVRSELALALNVSAERLKLKREIGLRQGTEVFEVNEGWADLAGNFFRISDPEVKEKRLRRFDNEMDQFPILRGRKSVVRISRNQRRESFPLKFR